MLDKELKFFLEILIFQRAKNMESLIEEGSNKQQKKELEEKAQEGLRLQIRTSSLLVLKSNSPIKGCFLWFAGVCALLWDL